MFLPWHVTVLLIGFEFQSSFPGAKIGFNKAMAAGWLVIDKNAEGGPRVMRKVCSI